MCHFSPETKEERESLLYNSCPIHSSGKLEYFLITFLSYKIKIFQNPDLPQSTASPWSGLMTLGSLVSSST